MDHTIWAVTAVIFATVIIAKIIAAKTATVDVLWLIVIGAVLGNLGIIPQESQALDYIGQIGIIFIMFALGFEESLENFINGIRKAWGIAIIGAVCPFIGAYSTALFMGYGPRSAVIWGLTMTATAVSLTLMSLRSRGLHRSRVTTGIISAAVVDDVLSLTGLAIVIPLLLLDLSGETTQNSQLFFNVLIVLGKVVLFFIILSIVGLFGFPQKRVTRSSLRKESKILWIPELFYRVTGLRVLLRSEHSSLLLIFIAIGIGALAHEFGFHPAIGAYFAALFLQEDYFIIKVKETKMEFKRHLRYTKRFINDVAFSIFGPIFFVTLGAKLLINREILISILPAVIMLFSAVFILQIISASLAARFTGKYHWHESVIIGFGMLGRAELALIVLNITFVQNSLITAEQFYILMFVTFLLNISVPLTIRWWGPYFKGVKQMKIGSLRLSRAKKPEN